ncbi:nacht and ankyrin domain protein [Colletotrichum kahawae]|uniref:Nacht and ankyrin domain protein n=1 Tax=Colletotrichum kahawae TaxID=34407 RepID=A0AAE0D2J5_COLKA|nr:nacht and ankyrin domain protein [Colletotrichum kahawae]
MASQPRGLRREDFQIAIICAVTCEYDAIAFAFDEIWDTAEVQLGNAPGDHNTYTIGRIANRNAVLLLLMGMGKVNAATAAFSLRSSYTGIKLVIVAGICGGVPGVGTQRELVLGDVVISRSIVQYDLGRRYTDRFATKDTIEDSLGRPHESVRSLTAFFETTLGRDSLQRRTNEILEDIQEKTNQKGNTYQRPARTEDRLFEPDYIHRHYDSWDCGCSERGACEVALQASCDELQCDLSRLMSRDRMIELYENDWDETPPHELRVVVGRLGSGDTVMKSGLDRDRIAGEQDLIAFEMEGAGIWDRFPCIVVKAVCDYADSHKNKKYQAFAAARAASATKAILEVFPYTDNPTRLVTEHIANLDIARQIEAADLNSPKAPRGYDPNERDLLELLAADHELHKNFNPNRVPGTCEWFVGDERYRKWLDSTTSSILWVSAGPGCGKSVLARALIDDGLLSTDRASTTICYFFFKDGDERRINSYDALSAILHQVFTQDQTGRSISHADDSFQKYGQKLRKNFYQLWNILVDCASSPEAGEIVCVLDALDECSKHGCHEIFQKLEWFYFGDQTHASKSRLKFIITSRPYDDLETSFGRMATAESYIRLDGDEKSEEIRQEIDLVIDHKVNEFGKDFRKDHRQKISERLKTMDNRTYLWLHLTLSIIDERQSAYRKPSSIQALLSRLPNSVFDAYEKILSRSQDEEQARHLFNIILAASKPLTLEEINQALTLQAREFENCDEVEDDMWPRDSFKKTIKNLCGLFISVFDGKVFFIHQTARDFLTTKSVLSTSWKGTFDIHQAHGTILTSCFRALSLSDIEKTIGSIFYSENHPFMRYASINWMQHYNSLDDITRDEYSDTARELCRTTRGLAPFWARERLGTRMHTEFVSDCTDLTLASYLGLLEIVELLIQREDFGVNSEGGHFGSAIKAAAAGGCLEVVQRLLEHDADCTTGGGEFQTALEAAVAGRHSEVANLLISRGCQITEEVLAAAVGNHNRRNQIAQLLEDYEDSVKITEAVIEGAAGNIFHGTGIIQFLLQRRGNEFRITQGVIQRAAANTRIGASIISLLLEERGDEFFITDDILWTAACNCAHGHDVVALLLSKRGYEVEITWDIILAAAEHGSEELMEFFLDEYEELFELTEDLTMAVANNGLVGGYMMPLLLDRFGDAVVITQEAITAAARAGFDSDLLAILLEEGGANVQVIQEVVVAAAMNMYGRYVMEYLLEEHGGEVEVTQEVILACRRNTMYGGDVMMLLRDKREDEVALSNVT